MLLPRGIRVSIYSIYALMRFRVFAIMSTYKHRGGERQLRLPHKPREKDKTVEYDLAEIL